MDMTTIVKKYEGNNLLLKEGHVYGIDLNENKKIDNEEILPNEAKEVKLFLEKILYREDIKNTDLRSLVIGLRKNVNASEILYVDNISEMSPKQFIDYLNENMPKYPGGIMEPSSKTLFLNSESIKNDLNYLKKNFNSVFQYTRVKDVITHLYEEKGQIKIHLTTTGKLTYDLDKFYPYGKFIIKFFLNSYYNQCNTEVIINTINSKLEHVLRAHDEEGGVSYTRNMSQELLIKHLNRTFHFMPTKDELVDIKFPSSEIIIDFGKRKKTLMTTSPYCVEFHFKSGEVLTFNKHNFRLLKFPEIETTFKDIK